MVYYYYYLFVCIPANAMDALMLRMIATNLFHAGGMKKLCCLVFMKPPQQLSNDITLYIKIISRSVNICLYLAHRIYIK